ncbi:MAG: hypothetical protein R6W87_02680 [Halospina sp.]
MPSLEKRVTRQRDAVVARGPTLRAHAARVHARLGHPVVLIPAFLGGMLVARGTPVLLRALPRLTAQLRGLTEGLRRLDAVVRLIASLALSLARLWDTETDGTNQSQPPV